MKTWKITTHPTLKREYIVKAKTKEEALKEYFDKLPLPTSEDYDDFCDDDMEIEEIKED